MQEEIFTYSKGLECPKCGSNDVKKEYSQQGIIFCTCGVCDAKFVAQSAGIDMRDRYVAERSRVFGCLKNAKSDDEKAAVKSELGKLVADYPVLTEIDPVYYWYNIDLITSGFTDLSARDKACMEYARIPTKNAYYISQDDEIRIEPYREQYKNFLHTCDKKKHKKIRTAIVSVLCFFAAVCTGAGLFLGLYSPSVSDGEVSVALDNASFGVFGKFFVSLQAEALEETSPQFIVAEQELGGIASKMTVYDLSLIKSSMPVQPESEVEVSVPFPDGYTVQNICVYHFEEDGSYSLLESAVMSDAVVFYTDSFSTFAVCEVPYYVVFESDGGISVDSARALWGEKADEPETPERVGYTFKGWYLDGSPYSFSAVVTKNITLTAVWEQNRYNITYIIDGEQIDAQQVVYGENVTLCKREKTGYVLSWYAEDGVQYADGVWETTSDVTLSGVYSLDPAYEGYVYISTVEGLANIASGTSKNYLLIEDLDMNGASWTVITSFSGTLDGGGHSVYNFKITSSAKYADTERVIGLFGKMSGKVLNLQIGSESATTSLNCVPWQQSVYAGFIAGYCSGTIINCRIINCTSYVQVSAQEDTYANTEWASNVGGVCGVVRNGTVSRCYVYDCTLESESWTRYNNISNQARAGGLCGYAASSTISDCFVKNTTVTSYARTEDSALFNKAGQPYSRAGGLVGEMVKESLEMTVTRCVVFGNAVKATKSVGSYSNGDGSAYAGCMMGRTASTTPSNLVGVKTQSNCSGSNSSYEGFTRISEDSFDMLILNTAFNNGYWISDGGAIALKFN